MPPTTRAAARAHAATAGAALPDHLLAHVLSFLPPGDAILTVPRLSKALAAEWAPRVAKLREAAADDRASGWCHPFADLDTFSIPLWALQEAWPRLKRWQRDRAVHRAAYHGDLAMLRWALPQRGDGDGGSFCVAAAAGGQLEALRCAGELGCAWQWDLCLASWDRRTCAVAASGGGHLAVLQWARAQQPPCPWDKDTCRAAASNGQLAVLQWARAQQPPCPWDEETCTAAAQYGHLAVLQWAHAQQPPCPWDQATCVAAASHLAVLQWARAQQPPCPWDKDTCKAAMPSPNPSEVPTHYATCPQSCRVLHQHLSWRAATARRASRTPRYDGPWCHSLRPCAALNNYHTDILDRLGEPSWPRETAPAGSTFATTPRPQTTSGDTTRPFLLPQETWHPERAVGPTATPSNATLHRRRPVSSQLPPVKFYDAPYDRPAALHDRHGGLESSWNLPRSS
jgi:hypothetical protein